MVVAKYQPGKATVKGFRKYFRESFLKRFKELNRWKDSGATGPMWPVCSHMTTDRSGERNRCGGPTIRHRSPGVTWPAMRRASQAAAGRRLDPPSRHSEPGCGVKVRAGPVDLVRKGKYVPPASACAGARKPDDQAKAGST